MTLAEKLAKDKKAGRSVLASSTPFLCGIRAARPALGLSAEDVSAACHVSRMTIAAIERGNSRSLLIAFRLAVFFGKEVSDLWKVRPGA